MRKKLAGIFAIGCCLPFLMVAQPIEAAQSGQGVEHKQAEQQVSYRPDNRLNPAVSPPSEDILYGVSALKQHDIWAAGYVGNFYTYNSNQPALEHWNGSNWRAFLPPNTSDNSGADLYGIAAVSSDNVYAVGESYGKAYILHWNGTSWQIDYANKGGGKLFAVTAIDKNDIWVAGSGLLLHWNGKTWHGISNIGVVLHGIVAISKNDVWAVGVDANQRAVMQHWNGRVWSRVDRAENYTSLNAITAVSTKNIWTVGLIGTQTLTLHWDGLQWRRVSSRNPGANYNELTSISAVGEKDIWAAGFTKMDTCLYYCAKQTLIEHWNGERWQEVLSPNVAMQDNVLQGVAALSANNVWAVGSTYAGYDSQYSGEMLIEHWDGQRWKIVSSV